MTATQLDVRGLRCPMTWVTAKLALDRLGPGAVLEVRCPPGEALENVPRAAREAGHAVAVSGDVVRIERA